MQSANAKLDFDEKLFTIMGSLHHHGFNAKPFYEITDFTKQLALSSMFCKNRRRNK